MSPVELQHPHCSRGGPQDTSKAEGAMVEGGCSPISEEEPGLRG